MSWPSVLKSKDVWAVTLSYFSFGYVAWIFFSWFYTYLAEVRGPESESQRFLRHASLPGDGSVLSGGRTDQRPADEIARARGIGRCYVAAVALCGRVGFYRVRCASAERTAGQRRAGRRRGHALSFAELVLVGHGRYCRRIFRIGFRFHEHGSTDRRHDERIADACDCRRVWMDCVVSSGGSALPAGREQHGCWWTRPGLWCRR